MINKSRLIPILEAVFTVVIWGGTFIATKIALQEVSPATVVWLRFAMGVAYSRRSGNPAQTICPSGT